MFNRKSRFNRARFGRQSMVLYVIENNLYPSKQQFGLLETKNYESEYQFGFEDVYEYPTDYSFGLDESNDYQPFNLDFMLAEEKPIFIKSRYGKGVRLGVRGLLFNTNLTGDYTIKLKRRAQQDFDWDDIVIRSDGQTFVNGELDNSYDTSWIGTEGTTNYLVNGDFANGLWTAESSRYKLSTDALIDKYSAKMSNPDGSWSGMSKVLGTVGTDFQVGDTFTLSFYAKSVDGKAPRVGVYNVTDTTWVCSNSGYINIADTKWHKFSRTFTIGSDDDLDTLRVYCYAHLDGVLGDIYYDGIQVEKKSHSTAFTKTSRPEGDLQINNHAWEIDELLILPSQIVSAEEILRWYENDIYYYSDENHSLITNPINISLDFVENIQ